ncbi:MAG TPA: hypothetical protein VJM32_03880, partial [Candidatus Saccharimonadales bacterium]|nr:hypothetical protein [Candidatus Saccharimonadales bacterium]
MRTELIAFKLGLPGNLDIETVAAWLGTIAATTHPPRFALINPPPVTVEVVATKAGIGHQHGSMDQKRTALRRVEDILTETDSGYCRQPLAVKPGLNRSFL